MENLKIKLQKIGEMVICLLNAENDMKFADFNKKLQERDVRKNKERVKVYGYEKEEKKKNLKYYTVCLTDLQLGKFDKIFND